MSKEIKNKTLINALKKETLEDIKLIKGEGYFYIVSEERNFVNSSIFVNSFNQLSIERWIKEIKQLITEDNTF